MTDEQRHYYHADGIPGGIECDGCGQVNTCAFIEGYYVDTPAGRRYREVIECDVCGTRIAATWEQGAPYPTRALVTG
jgi:hypothetical protein